MSGVRTTSINLNTISLKDDSVKVKSPIKKALPVQIEPVKPDNIKVEVKKGVVPTLEGSLAGALSATTATVAVAQIIEKGHAFSGSGGLAMAIPVGIALVTGTMVGGVASNLTTNKTKASVGGAIAGGVVAGALLATMSKEIKVVALFAGLGAVAGSVSGFAGASVAKIK